MDALRSDKGTFRGQRCAKLARMRAWPLVVVALAFEGCGGKIAVIKSVAHCPTDTVRVAYVPSDLSWLTLAGQDAIYARTRVQSLTRVALADAAETALSISGEIQALASNGHEVLWIEGGALTTEHGALLQKIDPGVLAIDDAAAYVSVDGSNVLRQPLDGGASTRVTSGGAKAIAVSGDSVYVARCEILRVPKKGGSAVAIVSQSECVTSIAASGTWLYWIVGAKLELRRMPLDGSAQPETLTDGVTHLAADGRGAAFMTRSTLEVVDERGARRTVAQHSMPFYARGAIALDGCSLAWFDPGGEIHRAPR